VYWELERKHGVKLDGMDFGTWAGKRMRGELLARLRKVAGLTYREISPLPGFSAIKQFFAGQTMHGCEKTGGNEKLSEATKSSTVP